MIKASECVRQGCLHVQSEACLAEEKVLSQEGANGHPQHLFENEKSLTRDTPLHLDFLFKTCTPFALPITANENVQHRASLHFFTM